VTLRRRNKNPHHLDTNATENKEWCLMCPLWWKSSCELQGMYGLQGPTKANIPTSLFEDMYSTRTNQANLIHSARSNMSSNNQTKFLCSHKHRAKFTHKSISPAKQRYTGIKNMGWNDFSNIWEMWWGFLYPSMQRQYRRLILLLMYYTATCFGRTTIISQKLYY
jgi:hypothetical protein